LWEHLAVDAAWGMHMAAAEPNRTTRSEEEEVEDRIVKGLEW
jgi:hypothetical protein